MENPNQTETVIREAQEINKLLKTNLYTHSKFQIANGLIDHNVIRLAFWFDDSVRDILETVHSW